eukprot:6209856-Pleurochrysis_carterae.AAC.1
MRARACVSRAPAASRGPSSRRRGRPRVHRRSRCSTRGAACPARRDPTPARRDPSTRVGAEGRRKGGRKAGRGLRSGRKGEREHGSGREAVGERQQAKKSERGWGEGGTERGSKGGREGRRLAVRAYARARGTAICSRRAQAKRQAQIAPPRCAICASLSLPIQAFAHAHSPLCCRHTHTQSTSMHAQTHARVLPHHA